MVPDFRVRFFVVAEVVREGEESVRLRTGESGVSKVSLTSSKGVSKGCKAILLIYRQDVVKREGKPNLGIEQVIYRWPLLGAHIL
jgi:hypothetical protein